MKETCFLFYHNWYDAINYLPYEEQREAFKAIIEYGLFGETSVPQKPAAKAILEMAKPFLDACNQCHTARRKVIVSKK